MTVSEILLAAILRPAKRRIRNGFASGKTSVIACIAMLFCWLASTAPTLKHGCTHARSQIAATVLPLNDQSARLHIIDDNKDGLPLSLSQSARHSFKCLTVNNLQESLKAIFASYGNPKNPAFILIGFFGKKNSPHRQHSRIEVDRTGYRSDSVILCTASRKEAAPLRVLARATHPLQQIYKLQNVNRALSQALGCAKRMELYTPVEVA